MDRNLQSELQARKDLPWQTGQRHESSQPALIRWVLVADIPTARLQLGLSEFGRWVRASKTSVSEFEAGSSCVFLLPVLEMKADDIRRVLGEGLRGLGLPEGDAESFPFEDVVLTGLTSGSENWSNLALNWVRQIGVSDRMREALQVLAQNGPTQAIRHASMRILGDKQG